MEVSTSGSPVSTQTTTPTQTPTPTPGRLGRAARKLLALVLGTLIAIALGEGLFRVAGFGRAVFHRPDGTYGMVLIPGAKGWYRQEGRSYVDVNSAGFRDIEHARLKAPNTLRIAVVGDSFTEAMQVPLRDTFWSVAARELQKCECADGQNVEVLSFGVSGYSTASELLVLQNRVWDWSPDVVVLAFLSGNDVADNHPALGAVASPFFKFIGDRLVLDSSRARSLGSTGRALLWMVRRSQVLQVVNQVRLNYGICGKVSACGEDLDTAKGEAGLRNEIYLEPTEPRWKEAWRVTEALILKMRDDVESHGAMFQVVGLSNSIQVHPDAAVRSRFAASIGASDLSYPDRRMTEFAQRHGIAYLALAPILAKQAAVDNRFYHGFKKTGMGKGHWNSEGHRLAGRTIASWLPKNLNTPGTFITALSSPEDTSDGATRT